MGYLVLDGTGGNGPSAPDSAALSIVGELDIQVKLANDDVVSGANQVIVSKRLATGFEYGFRYDTIGRLELYWHNGSSYVQPGVSDSAVPFADGEVGWVRCTREVNGANYDVKYYTSNDNGASWSQLGATKSVATASNAPTDSANIVTMFARNGSNLNVDTMSGKLYRVKIGNSIDGDPVFDADFSSLSSSEVAAGQFTESSTNAATVTISGSAWSYVRDAKRFAILGVP